MDMTINEVSAVEATRPSSASTSTRAVAAAVDTDATVATSTVFSAAHQEALILEISIFETLLRRSRQIHGRTKYFQRMEMALRCIVRAINARPTSATSSTKLKQRPKSARCPLPLTRLFKATVDFREEWGREKEEFKRKRKRKEVFWEISRTSNSKDNSNKFNYEAEGRPMNTKQSATADNDTNGADGASELGVVNRLSQLCHSISDHIPEAISRLEHAAQFSFVEELVRRFYMSFHTVALAAMARIRTLLLYLGYYVAQTLLHLEEDAVIDGNKDKDAAAWNITVFGVKESTTNSSHLNNNVVDSATKSWQSHFLSTAELVKLMLLFHSLSQSTTRTDNDGLTIAEDRSKEEKTRQSLRYLGINQSKRQNKKASSFLPEGGQSRSVGEKNRSKRSRQDSESQVDIGESMDFAMDHAVSHAATRALFFGHTTKKGSTGNARQLSSSLSPSSFMPTHERDTNHVLAEEMMVAKKNAKKKRKVSTATTSTNTTEDLDDKKHKASAIVVAPDTVVPSNDGDDARNNTSSDKKKKKRKMVSPIVSSWADLVGAGGDNDDKSINKKQEEVVSSEKRVSSSSKKKKEKKDTKDKKKMKSKKEGGDFFDELFG